MSTFKFSKYNSRRSDVLGLNGSVATSHPLAANAGLDILKKGGNAVDAAITAAAVLNVVEPMSTGIGGDVFSLLYLNDNSEVIALNGSGRSGSKVNYDYFIENNLDQIPFEGPSSGLSVSVPGAVGFNMRTGDFHVFKAKTVIVAAGGASHIFKPRAVGEGMGRTWYAPWSNGSAYALPIEVGAKMTQMENRIKRKRKENESKN